MRIDRDRIGALDPAEERTQRVRHRRDAAIRAVDVHPQSVLGADVGDLVERIDRAGRDRAGGRDHRERLVAVPHVALDRGAQRVGAHATVGRRTESMRTASRPMPSMSAARVFTSCT